MSAGPARLLFAAARPLLARLDPETAHGLTVTALKTGLAGGAGRAGGRGPAALRSRVFGLDFPNPVGLAAGFDKNGEVPRQMLGLGFGFVEAGTVTPRPQAGNPRPRLFRLGEDRAVINRLGFNNDGHAALAARLERLGDGGLIGVNIGANKDSADRIADYCAGVQAFAGRAKWLTLNISSPNTPGLRDLQGGDDLKKLLDAVVETRARLKGAAGTTPLLLKIAPDLDRRALQDICDMALARKIDGLIISNTTLARPPLKSAMAAEVGGLSGAPLFAPSTRLLAMAFLMTGGALPLIGVGGIASAQDAYDKIRAGAALTQLYSALIYQGPGLVSRIRDGLAERLAADGRRSLADAVGGDAAALAR